jgi:hypothetical protein
MEGTTPLWGLRNKKTPNLKEHDGDDDDDDDDNDDDNGAAGSYIILLSADIRKT